MSLPDYYALLHVAPDAPEAVIKASYRAVMQKLRAHPDLGGDPAQAALLNQALQVLLDADQRRRYDQTRAAQAQSAPEAPPEAQPSQTPDPQSAPAEAAEKSDGADVYDGVGIVPVASTDAEVCAFCGHPNRRPPTAMAAYGQQRTRCGRCHAPLTPVARVAAVTQDGELRRLLRVTHDAVAEIRTQQAPSEWHAAQLRDFSVTGVSVMLDQAYATGACLHLRSQGIEAVATVVNSRQQADGKFCLGLACETLIVDLSPGTFVSSTC